MKTNTAIVRMILLLGVGTLGVLCRVASAPAQSPIDVHISGRVHLEDIGDKSMKDRAWAGTKGESRRLEGFEMKIDPPVEGLGHLFRRP